MFNKIQTTIDLLISGAIGSVLSLMFHDDINTWKRKLIVVTGGTVFSLYVAPFTIEFFGIGTTQPTAIGFFCGLFGMSLTAAIMRMLRNIDLIEFGKLAIERIFGGGSNGGI